MSTTFQLYQRVMMITRICLLPEPRAMQSKCGISYPMLAKKEL